MIGGPAGSRSAATSRAKTSCLPAPGGHTPSGRSGSMSTSGPNGAGVSEPSHAPTAASTPASAITARDERRLAGAGLPRDEHQPTVARGGLGEVTRHDLQQARTLEDRCRHGRNLSPGNGHAPQNCNGQRPARRAVDHQTPVPGLSAGVEPGRRRAAHRRQQPAGARTPSAVGHHRARRAGRRPADAARAVARRGGRRGCCWACRAVGVWPRSPGDASVRPWQRTSW